MMPGWGRRGLTLVFQLLDRRPVLLILFLGLAAVNAMERVSDTIEIPETVQTSVLALSVLFGGLYSLSEIAKKVNIWRLFPPAYRGFPRARELKCGKTLRAQYALLHGEDSPLRQNLFLRSDGVILIDAVRLLDTQRHLLARLIFPGEDEALNRIAASINLKAFSGTLYGTNFEEKFVRNHAISTKNLLSFALVRHAMDERLYVGLSSVLPLDTVSTAAYGTAQISDNDISAENVTALDETPASLVLFMVAHQPTYLDETSRRHMHSPQVIQDLILTMVLQVTLFVVVADTPRIPIIGGAYGGRIEMLLETLGLSRSRTLKSADGLVMFANKVAVTDKAAARAWLETEVPDLAARLFPANYSLPARMNDAVSPASAS